MRISIFKHGDVGNKIESWIRQEYPTHIQSVFTQSYFDLYRRSQNIPSLLAELQEQNLDYIILAWWPYIVKKDIIEIPRKGVINLHPSYLPYNRGKNYWFWNLVEDVPYGVTIHKVDESIDGGDILFQRQIEKTWEDTGETLFNKAQSEIVELFKESYSKLVNGNFTPQQQTPSSVHYSRDLERASEIFLNKTYTGQQLLNILRARSSDRFPGCYFYDQNKKYEVKVSIQRI